ncbi:MAG: high frequency lysogenization protein [Flavobacteriales bacterium]
MKSSWNEIIIALAGTVQAISQVEHIAKTGYVNTHELEVSINSLFVSSPDKTIEVYGTIANLLPGLEKLQNLLTRYRDPLNMEVLRYLLGVIHIQKKLMRKKTLLGKIAERIEKSKTQVDHFGLSHENVLNNIAGIYTDTISTFQYRIQVTGNYNYLQQDRVANQIRALLLAGIRSSMLWRQLGGRRWHFVAYRSQLVNTTELLIEHAKAELNKH